MSVAKIFRTRQTRRGASAKSVVAVPHRLLGVLFESCSRTGRPVIGHFLEAAAGAGERLQFSPADGLAAERVPIRRHDHVAD